MPVACVCELERESVCGGWGGGGEWECVCRGVGVCGWVGAVADCSNADIMMHVVCHRRLHRPYLAAVTGLQHSTVGSRLPITCAASVDQNITK